MSTKNAAEILSPDIVRKAKEIKYRLPHIPSCLHRPLVFGDEEQIAALRKLEDAIGEVRDGEMKTYQFTYSGTGRVEAISEQHADQLAQDMIGYDCNIDSLELV